MQSGTTPHIPSDWQLSEKNWQQGRNAFRRQLDLTENVALAHQFQEMPGSKGKIGALIAYDFEAEQLEDTKRLTEETNQVRRAFRRDIVSFATRLNNAQTMTQRCDSFL